MRGWWGPGPGLHRSQATLGLCSGHAGKTRNWWRLSHAGVDCRGRTDKVAAVNLGPTELFIILLVVLVLFGGTKLPKLARSMGQGQTELKRGCKEGSNPTPDDDEPTDKA